MLELRRHGPVTELLMGPSFGGRNFYPVRAYLVDGLLIDAGPPVNRAELQRWLREGHGGLPIREVVFTHHHEDHAGNLGLLRAELGLVPWAHAEGVPLLRALPRIPTYRRVVWGEGQAGEAQALGGALMGERHRWEVVHTPGHAPDHIALWAPEAGWLFSGDLFVSAQHKLLRPEEDPHLWIESLARVGALPVGELFCAHRGRVAQGQAALLRKHEGMVHLRDQVRALHAEGLPERAIVRRLLGREDALHYFSGGDFARRHLVRAFLPGWPGPVPLPPPKARPTA